MRSLYVIGRPHLRDVEHGGADGDGDGLWFWMNFRKHVACIVVQPLGLGAIALRRESYRAANLDDHFGYGFRKAFHHEVVVLDVRREVPGRGVADVEVQEPGAGIVTIHRRLDLLVPGDRNIRSIAG